jgi:hypothetical protein
MNIEMDEIGCITKEIRRVGTNIKGYAIVLFDRNATGYCSSGLIINNLAQIFTYARELLNCDCKQACNKCLLQNDTKYNYQDLDRNKALEFLTEEWIEKNTLPSNMKIFGESSSVLTTSLENVIEDIKGISEIFFIIPDASDNDDFTASPIYRLINRLSMANILTNLCFNSEAISSDTREVLSALGKHPSIHFKSRPQNLNPSIMAIVHTGDRYYGYGSLDETVQHLDSNWGSACNTSVITGRFDAQTVIFEDYKLEKYSEQNYDKIYEFTSELNDSGLKFGKHLLDILHFNIDPYIQETKIKSITYKDRYLKNPLSTGLLFSFIKELKDRYSKKWACCEITIDVAAYNEDKSPIPQMCYHDWTSIDEQKKVYSEIFQTIDLKCYLREHNKKYLEHTRIMEIILENSSIIQIILDQGFSYWRCLPYHYQDNFFPFLQDEHIQAEHIINKLPPITGDVFPTRIFCRIIK